MGAIVLSFLMQLIVLFFIRKIRMNFVRVTVLIKMRSSYVLSVGLMKEKGLIEYLKPLID